MNATFMASFQEDLTESMVQLPKKYSGRGSSAFRDLIDAERFAKELTKETGIKHTVEIDENTGTAVVLANKLSSDSVLQKKPRLSMKTKLNINHCSKESFGTRRINIQAENMVDGIPIEESFCLKRCNQRRRLKRSILEKEKEHGTKLDAVYCKKERIFALFPQNLSDFNGTPIAVGDRVYTEDNCAYKVLGFQRCVDGFYDVDITWKLLLKPYEESAKEKFKTSGPVSRYPQSVRKTLWSKKDMRRYKKIASDNLPYKVFEFIEDSWKAVPGETILLLVLMAVLISCSILVNKEIAKANPQMQIQHYQEQIQECQQKISDFEQKIQELQEQQE